MKNEEKELEELGQTLSNLSIPHNLDDYVQAGIHRSQREKKPLRLKHWMRASIAAALVILMFGFGIRLSPAFARTVSHVPGFSYIVKLINGDPSLEQAVRNHYIQKLDLTKKSGNTVITLDSMIADRHRLIIFYQMESADISAEPQADLLNADHKNLPVALSYNFPEDNKNMRRIDINLTDVKDADLTGPLILKVKAGSGTFDFKIPYNLNEMKQKVQSFTLNKTVALEGQKLTFNTVNIYPTGAEVKVSYDPDNTKKITHLNDLRLTDEKGHIFASIKNGVSALGDSGDGHQTLFLDSSYFSRPEALHLKLSGARAIDKKEQDVVVSLKDKKLLKAPADHRLKLKSIKETPQQIALLFAVKHPASDHIASYQIFSSEFHDKSGKGYSETGGGTAFKETDSQWTEQEIRIPNKNYKGPLTFRIIDYPAYITGNIDMPVKGGK